MYNHEIHKWNKLLYPISSLLMLNKLFGCYAQERNTTLNQYLCNNMVTSTSEGHDFQSLSLDTVTTVYFPSLKDVTKKCSSTIENNFR